MTRKRGDSTAWSKIKQTPIPTNLNSIFEVDGEFSKEDKLLEEQYLKDINYKYTHKIELKNDIKIDCDFGETDAQMEQFMLNYNKNLLDNLPIAINCNQVEDITDNEILISGDGMQEMNVDNDNEENTPNLSSTTNSQREKRDGSPIKTNIRANQFEKNKTSEKINLA